MTRVQTLVFLLGVTVLALGCRPSATASLPARAGAPQSPTDRELVSVVRLLASPDLYDGKRVTVLGYCSLAREGTSLWLHEEDFRRNLVTNAVWLEITDRVPEKLLPGGEGYAIVQGVFDSKITAYRGRYRCGIRVDDVTALPPRISETRPESTP